MGPLRIASRGRGDVERRVADPERARLARHVGMAQENGGGGDGVKGRIRRRPDRPLKVGTHATLTSDGLTREIEMRRCNAELYCREEARLAFFEELNELYDTPDAQDVSDGSGTAPGEVT